VPSCNQQFLGRKARDDLMAGFGHNYFFFDPRHAPAVGFSQIEADAVPYCKGKAACSSGKPNSCALGHTGAISAVVRPDAQFRFAPSRYSRHRLYASFIAFDA
jgi:hypothetical protein